MTKTFIIEKFTNALGQTKFRFAVPSILHKGQWSRSLNSWETYSGAYKAAQKRA